MRYQNPRSAAATVLGARSAWRPRIRGPAATERPGEAPSVPDTRPEPAVASATPSPRPWSNLLWAQLMQRSFGFDVLACPRCGGQLRLIALIEDPGVIRRILGHLGVPTERPAARPPRAPPMPFERCHDHVDDDIAVV